MHLRTNDFEVKLAAANTFEALMSLKTVWSVPSKRADRLYRKAFEAITTSSQAWKLWIAATDIILDTPKEQEFLDKVLALAESTEDLDTILEEIECDALSRRQYIRAVFDKADQIEGVKN